MKNSMSIMKKGGLLVLLSLLVGCTSTSNKFDKSPCACEFEQINTGSFGGKANV